MADEYQFRKEIDALRYAIEHLDDEDKVTEIKRELTDKLDKDLDVLSTDLVEFQGTLVNLRGSLIDFNEELINFDETNTNLANDLTKLKDNLHLFLTSVNSFSTHLDELDSNLSQFDSDVFGEQGLDTQLTNLATIVGDENGGLVKGLSDLDASLVSLDAEVFGEEGLETQLTNLATVVGDNNGGLVKGLNDLETSLNGFDGDLTNLSGRLTTLSTTVGDSNSGLVKKANDTASSVTQLNTDLNTLNTSLNGVKNTVGDNTKGLVKGLNDLSSSVDSLDNNVFGTNGLSSNVSSLSNTIGDNSKGLVKQMNDLSSSVDSLDSDTDALASRLTTVEGSLSTVSSGLTNTDSDLKKLVYSLDKLSGYLTDFEGSLEDLEDEIADDPNIDVSKLNANMVALFGAISEVKSNVSTVETDMYGSGTSENPSQGSLLADMSTAQSDISSAQTSIGNVKTDLYGSSGSASSPQTGSLKKNLEEVKTTVGDNNSGLVKNLNDTSTNITNVKTDLYGTNGTASNPQTNSLKKNLQNVKSTVGDANSGLVKDLNTASSNISTVQTDMYGSNKNPNAPQEGSLVYDLTDLNDTITSEGGLIDQVSDVQDGIGDVNDKIGDTSTAGTILYNVHQVKDVQVPAVQDALYGKSSNGTVSSPTANSALGKVNAVKTEMYGANGTSSSPADGSLKKNLNTLKDTTVPAVQTALYGNGSASSPAPNSTMGKINAVRTDMYGSGDATNPQSGSLKHSVNQVKSDINDPNTGLKVQTQEIIETIGDENTQGTVLYDIDQSKTGVNNLQKKMYKGENGNGTIANPADGTLIKQTNTAITQIGDANSGLIKDVNTVQSDISDVQGDIGNVNRANGDSPLQTQIKQLPCYIEKIWVCTNSSANEIIKLSSTGTARIGIKFTEVAKKALRDGNDVPFSPIIVSPSNVKTGENQSIILTPSVTLPTDRIIYFSNINFNEVGIWKVMCENLSYTVQVGDFQPRIPNFSLITSQTGQGVTFKVYSDGLNVYVVFNGTAVVTAGSSTSPSTTNLLTLSDTAYAPIVNTQVPARESAGGHRMKLNSSGVIQYLNDTSGTSFSVHGAFYYPLKSRLP